MKLTFSNGQNTVTISNEESSETFQVNDDNRLLVQRSELTEAYGQYTVDVEGEGFAFIQVMDVYLRGRWMLPVKKVRLSVQLYMKCYFPILHNSIIISTHSLIDMLYSTSENASYFMKRYLILRITG